MNSLEHGRGFNLSSSYKVMSVDKQRNRFEQNQGKAQQLMFDWPAGGPKTAKHDTPRLEAR